MKENKSFKAYIKRFVVTVIKYHSENGRLQDNKFMQAVKGKQQEIYFCGVNYNLQKGKKKKRISPSQN